jgi:hypothetical protein
VISPLHIGGCFCPTRYQVRWTAACFIHRLVSPWSYELSACKQHRGGRHARGGASSVGVFFQAAHAGPLLSRGVRSQKQKPPSPFGPEGFKLLRLGDGRLAVVGKTRSGARPARSSLKRNNTSRFFPYDDNRRIAKCDTVSI